MQALKRLLLMFVPARPAMGITGAEVFCDPHIPDDSYMIGSFQVCAIARAQRRDIEART